MRLRLKFIGMSAAIFLILFCTVFNMSSVTVFASTEDYDYNTVLNELFEDNTVNEALEEVFGEKRLGLRELVENLISGKMNVTEVFSELVLNSGKGLSRYKTIFIKLIVLCLFCALFGYLPQIFGSEQASQTGHFISFIILTAYLLSLLSDTLAIVQDTIEVIIFLMNAIIPVYMIAVAVSGAISTAGFASGIFEILIYFTQHFINKFMCPVVMVFVLVGFANQLLESDKFSKLSELIKKIFLWVLKGMLTLLIGVQFLQNLISPYVDKFNSSVTKQTLEAIPGVGDIASSGIGIAVGAAMVVKNSIGVVAMLLLLAVVAAPFLELIIYGLVLMLINAILQPVLQSQTMKILEVSATAVKLLIRVLLTVILLFLISVAILAAGAGGV